MMASEIPRASQVGDKNGKSASETAPSTAPRAAVGKDGELDVEMHLSATSGHADEEELHAQSGILGSETGTPSPEVETASQIRRGLEDLQGDLEQKYGVSASDPSPSASTETIAKTAADVTKIRQGLEDLQAQLAHDYPCVNLEQPGARLSLEEARQVLRSMADRAAERVAASQLGNTHDSCEAVSPRGASASSAFHSALPSEVSSVRSENMLRSACSMSESGSRRGGAATAHHGHELQKAVQVLARHAKHPLA